MLGSHHQKSAIVQLPGETVGYCGGIDLAGDRWDTSRHHNDPRRVRTRYFGWHDVHARVRGAAALDIERNFRERWNDREYPSILPFPMHGSRIPRPVPPPPPISTPLPGVAPHPGTHHVQVLRTFACAGNHFASFAPAGEITCLNGYLKAISCAMNYIYVEDQYLVSEQIARAIAAVLPRLGAVVIVVPREADTPPVAAFNWHQQRFLDILRAVDASKVHVTCITWCNQPPVS